MNTFRLCLHPDKQFPMFQRLVWEVVDVPFRNVLEQGIHPWPGTNQHHDLPDAFLERLNEEEYKPAGLRDHHLLNDVNLSFINHWNKGTRFEQLLEFVEKSLLFCKPDLDFAELSGIARQTLAERWNSALALRLAERLAPSFPELRRFLKSRDKSVKLRGHMDLSDYDWSQILSLDDFANHERLLIEEAMQPFNFRTVSFLEDVTDGSGRLRLMNSIDHISLTQPMTDACRVPIQWQAERQGTQWRLRPNVGASHSARNAAQAFAGRWQRDSGRLCFSTSTDKLVEMVETDAASATFPGLRYVLAPYSVRVTAQFADEKVPLYVLGGFPMATWSGERLKSLLRDFDAPTSGVKKKLVERLGALAASEFAKHQPLLEGYFSENRFVRVSKDVKLGQAFPVLDSGNSLKGLLLHLYALRHLRANVVIDPAYENESCGIGELALGLMSGRITLPGGFLQVLPDMLNSKLNELKWA